MPYRGRPSAGCLTCRQRKIKCDRRDGGCDNCARAKFSCPGYRNLTDLLFLDESTEVVRKANTARPRRKFVVPTPPSVDSTDVEGPPPSTKSLPPLGRSVESSGGIVFSRPNDLISTATFLPKLDDIALAYFFSRYVFRHATCKSWTVEDGNGCLVTSMRALGIAGLTQAGNGPSNSTEARAMYMIAIRLVSEAVGSSKLAKRDSTLQAINILGIFEVITGFNRSLNSWRDHVNGAAALLQLRGAAQFDTETGGRLFIQTSHTLIVCCIQRRLPIPDHIWDMMRTAEDILPKPTDGAFLFQKTSMRFADLYSRLLPGNWPIVESESGDIIREALAVEADFVDILDKAPPAWQYDTAYGSGPGVYAGYYHVYRSYLMAQLLNAMRSYRIILRDIIFKATDRIPNLSDLHLSARATHDLLCPRASTSELQAEILASIPQHLGTTFSQSHGARVRTVDIWGGEVLWANFQPTDHNPFRFRRSHSPDLPFVRMSGGYLLQFPLYITAMASPPGHPLRLWAIKTLKLLGKAVGVKQALLLASVLDVSKEQFVTQGSERLEAWKMKQGY